ncbi:hypothetical protein [Clostridium arbusti]|uniref:hypothetical protein n=1 Tax=Clostridium arbusti TaxID=1137848 RepID=UPI0003175978|nr:hypothetical protein [Clostridium arbusti]
MMKNKINVGIGFVSGRKSFKNVVKTYIDSWNESNSLENGKIAIHLFVAYDLKYSNTKVGDYTITDEGILNTVVSAHYMSDASIEIEAQILVKNKVLTNKEAKLLFGQGYGMKRNAILYLAIKYNMDYLIFLDDDEYPIATVKIANSTFWMGQSVIADHIEYLNSCDITHGYHCGYVSPIPQIKWNNKLSEEDFKLFIEAISNDIINWDSIKDKMNSGGVTYGDLSIIYGKKGKVVQEINGMKFISGSNLGLNLKNCNKLFPFYNPPGARGEDTFLSTCIGDCDVTKIPCYAFHDGFSYYQHLLKGVLPIKLKEISVDDSYVVKRFLKASIGWIRYKPLLTYITNQENYNSEIIKIRENLTIAVPKICDYFKNKDFERVLTELEYYNNHVEQHFKDFQNTKLAWIKVMEFLKCY